ncbi:MAG: hypothetical protein RIT35_1396 [Pseudomonadota bacterium]|jgi:hypothetical protein
MISLADIPNVTNAIRDAVAPVFLITGIGSILGVLTNRLARSIDRYRNLSELKVHEMSLGTLHEIKTISKRILWIRRSVSLCTYAILCVCLTIASFFIAVEFNIDFSLIISILFIVAMLSLILGLFCFLREISLATKETQGLTTWIDKSP